MSLNIYTCSDLHSMIIHHPITQIQLEKKKKKIVNKNLSTLKNVAIKRHTQGTIIGSLKILFIFFSLYSCDFVFWKGFVGLLGFSKLTLLWFLRLFLILFSFHSY